MASLLKQASSLVPSGSADNYEDDGPVRIPQPPTHMLGLLGNIPDIDPAFPNKSFWSLADIYGPIVLLDLLNRQDVVISNQELINEVCNDDRFEKHVGGPLEELRSLLYDGLFTSYPGEENWSKPTEFSCPYSDQWA